MAIKKCRTCRQPVLASQAICPHCAVAGPTSRRRPGMILLILFLVTTAVTTAVIHRSGGSGPADPPREIGRSSSSGSALDERDLKRP